MVIIAATCVILATLAVLWFSPLRSPLLRKLSHFHRNKFTCKIDCLVDESKPINQDKVFCVRMIGRIPTPCDGTDTDVCIELTDITGSIFRPDLVLSVDEKYRASDNAGFWYVAHNGIIPKKNAILSSWKTIAEIPSYQLRFAYRGRRKLLFKVSIVAHESGDILISDQQTIEYVSCLDGYKELQNRKLEVLKASVNLVTSLGDTSCDSFEKTKAIILRWLEQEMKTFPAAVELAEWVRSLPVPSDDYNREQDIERLLAFAKQTDKLAVIELTLQSFAVCQEMTAEQFGELSAMAEQLQIKRSRFFALCQKILLFSECKLYAPALLLGIDKSMDEDTFRLRLNEEYRKWNARVTHPDDEIRRQADRMLSLIAELRSTHLVSKVS